MAYKLGKEKQGFFHDYALSIALCIMFLMSWLAQGLFQWFDESQTAQTHGESLTWDTFLPALGSATLRTGRVNSCNSSLSLG